MTDYEPGTRVMAILSADEKTVVSLGMGTYVGDLDTNVLKRPNPCIELDSGYIAWGYQCWWGPIDGFEKWINGREIVEVPEEDLAGHALAKKE